MSIKSGRLTSSNKGHKDYDKWLVYNKGKMREYRHQMRLAALKAYSSDGIPRCACPRCPEHTNPHIEFLVLDHVNGDGAEHRKQLGSKPRGGTSLALYTWLRDNDYPEGIFQILCYNCNAAKGTSVNYVCPHMLDA